MNKKTNLSKIIKSQLGKLKINTRKKFLDIEIKIKKWLIKKNIYKSRGIYYISNSESLPPPLTIEEELALIERLKTNDKEAKQTLIKRNLRLVVYIARRFGNSKIPIEDLVSIGTIGLIKAASTFNSSKNTKFATYASKCIENEILMHMRKNVKEEMIQESSSKFEINGKETQWIDMLSTEIDITEKDMEDKFYKELLYNALNFLPKREQKIIKLRYGLGDIEEEEKTQKEVADKLGISQSYISRLEKKIIDKLKKYMRLMIEEEGS